MAVAEMMGAGGAAAPTPAIYAQGKAFRHVAPDALLWRMRVKI
jgi:hypothetical protein